MRNTIKFLGLIALTAIIGFSMAACGDDEPELFPPTAAPANVKAVLASSQPTGDLVGGLNHVTVSWDAVDGATEYNLVVRIGTSTGPIARVPTVTGTTFNVEGLYRSTKYYFSVTAKNADGFGPASDPVSLTTMVPGIGYIPATLTVGGDMITSGIHGPAGLTTGTVLYYRVNLALTTQYTIEWNDFNNNSSGTPARTEITAIGVINETTGEWLQEVSRDVNSLVVTSGPSGNHLIIVRKTARPEQNSYQIRIRT